MKLTRTLLTLALLAAAPATALAQGDDGTASGRSIGADGVVFLPVGDFSDAVDIGFGALGKIQLPVMSQLAVTGRVGFLYDITAADGLSLWHIPIYGGARYFIKPGFTGLYVAGELGITYSHVSIDGAGSDSETDLGMTLGAGFKMGKIDLRAALWMWDLGHAGDSMALMGSVGYDFASF